MIKSTGLKRSLSLGHVILFGLSFMAPVTVFTTYGIAIESTQGMIPTAYIIALVVMLFTAYSYEKMVKEFPITGSAYTYVQKGINPSMGFLVGWVILLDYLLSPMISALLFGLFVHAYVPAISVPVCIIIFVIIITVINILGIRLATNVSAILLAFQIIFILTFCFFCIQGLIDGKGTGELFSITPFFDSTVNLSSILSIVPLLCFSFLGFDAVTTLAEETKNPKETLPRAIYIITIIGGVLFVVSTYFAQAIFPNINSFKDPESAAIDILIYAGGNFLNAFFLSVTITAAIASAVASGGSGARVLYAMGRENILPKRFFGYLSPRFRTPANNIMVIAFVAMSALFLDLNTAAAFINFGALFAFTFVNLSVIFHYFGRKKQRTIKDIVLYFVIPLIGASITALFWSKLDIYSMILGSAWLLVGFVYLVYLTSFFRQRPPELDFDESQMDVQL